MAITKKDLKTEEELKQYLKQNIGDTLYHYTTYESLLNILDGKTLRLSRTTLLNDKQEVTFGGKNRFVMSLTGPMEYVALWAIYGKDSGIKIRIDFPKKEFKECFTEENIVYREKDGSFSNYFSNVNKSKRNSRCLFSSIVYLNKKKDPTEGSKFQSNHYFQNGTVFPNLEVSEEGIEKLSGLIKYKVWEFEKEVRAQIIEDPNSPMANTDPNEVDKDHVYIKLSDEFLKNIHVTFNPWMSDIMKKVLRENLQKQGIECQDSYYDGEISEM